MGSKQKLNLFDFTMIVVGLVIGMGIFRTAATSAKYAISPNVYFAAWIVGGVVALCGALTYAEIGSRYPVMGGYYRVFSYAYHPSIAFSINCIILISNAASLGAVALIGSGYISRALLGQADDTVKEIISVIAVAIFYLVNLAGLRMSAKTQTVLMIIKIGMLLVMVAALFMPSIFYHGAAGADTNPNPETANYSWIQSLGICMIAASFTYGGYQHTINFGSEVNRPKKYIPRGIFMGIAIIIILYLLVNFAYYKVLGFQDLGKENEIAAVVVGKMFGETGGNIFSVLLFLSVLTYVNGQLMSNPRIMLAMSEDGVLPAAFQKRSVKREVLVVSLTVFAAICIILIFFSKTFDKILNFTIFLDSMGMAASAASIFWIRPRTKDLNNTGIYKMKLYPLLPIIFISAYLFVAGSIAVQTPAAAITSFAVLAACMIIYFATAKRAKQKFPGEISK
ncbi:MAG TPA: amino acid permease [Chitinophagaceae bacterium]|nr:amino acid permease [Chitinophagaceae bacterium]